MGERIQVLIHGVAASEEVPGLAALGDIARFRCARTLDELRAALPGAAVLLGWDFRAGDLEQAWDVASDLRWIHWGGAGVDALLFPRLVDSDVVVTNARGVFDRAIAEYVLGAILAFAKDLPATLQLQRERRWQHRDTERIDGRHVAIVGAGSIGTEIGRLCAAAGMRVSGVARRERDGDPVFGAVRAAEALPQILATADYAVIAAPLTPHTEGLFDRAMLRHLPPWARLINVGRGPIVVTADLVAALRAKQLAGAALDVFDTEPLPADHPLWAMDNVIVSAHMAGDFVGWREQLSRQFLDNFDRWRAGQPLHNVVDKRRVHAAGGRP